MGAKDLWRMAKTIEWVPDSAEEQYYFIQTFKLLGDRMWGNEPIIACWQRVPWALRNTIGTAISEVIEGAKTMGIILASFAWDLEVYMGYEHSWYLK